MRSARPGDKRPCPGGLPTGQRYRLAKYCDMGVKAIAALMEFS